MLLSYTLHHASPNSNPRIPTWQSENITQIFALLAEFGEASNPTRWWAEIIPPLSKLPEWMQWWRPEALQFQQRQNKVWMGYLQDLKKKMQEGTAPECFVKQFAESKYEEKGIGEMQAAYVAGSKYPEISPEISPRRYPTFSFSHSYRCFYTSIVLGATLSHFVLSPVLSLFLTSLNIL